MILKIILIAVMFSLAFIAQAFFKATWAIPLAFVIVIVYIVIKIIGKILRKRGGSSSDDDGYSRYFDGIFTEIFH